MLRCLDTIVNCADMLDVKFRVCLCRWLCLAGAEGWAPIAALFRGALKDSITPLLCSLATEDNSSGRPHVILEPYEQLVNLGEVPASSLSIAEHLCCFGNNSSHKLQSRLAAGRTGTLANVSPPLGVPLVYLAMVGGQWLPLA